MSRWRADGLLLLTALIFGLAFLAQKEATGRVGPLAFVAARFLLSTLVLAPLALWERRRAASAMSSRDWLLALGVGLAMFAGSAMQQIGMMTASATNGGFLTALYVVLTPFVVWGLTGQRPATFVFVACALSIVGAWALATNGQALKFASDDLALLGADIGWALVLALTSIFLARTPRPYALAFTQYAVCFVLSWVCSAAFEATSWAGMRAAAAALLYAGVLAGGVGFTIQLLALKHTPPSEAALILSLEGVFGAMAGAWRLGERLTAVAALGCLLILASVAVAELGPALGGRRRNKLASPGEDVRESAGKSPTPSYTPRVGGAEPPTR